MKTTLKEKLNTTSAAIQTQGQKAFKHPITSILSLCLVAGIAATIAGFSQAPRVITSTTGEALTVKLVDKTADSVEVIRVSDSKRVKIPLDRLCEADRVLIAAWNPPIQNYRPSSVSIAGSSGIQKKSYPSFYQPRYASGGARSSGSKSGSCRTYRQTCTGRTVTVVTPGGCPRRATPCPQRP